MSTSKLVSALAMAAALGIGSAAGAQETPPVPPAADQGAAGDTGEMPATDAESGGLWRHMGKQAGQEMAGDMDRDDDGRRHHRGHRDGDRRHDGWSHRGDRHWGHGHRDHGWGDGRWDGERHGRGMRGMMGGMGMMHGMMHGMGPMGMMGGPGMADYLWSQIDTNGDGSVSRDEIQAAGKARFDRADADHDGQLSADEIAAEAKRIEEERQDARRRAMAARMIDRKDDNGDGKLSADELRLPRLGEHLLDRADADHDGTVSKSEYDASMEQMRERFRHRFMGHDDGQDRDR
jgi:hypothetical protein